MRLLRTGIYKSTCRPLECSFNSESNYLLSYTPILLYRALQKQPQLLFEKMKLVSLLFSLYAAAIATAIPLVDFDAITLEDRQLRGTKEYTAISAVHSDLEVGKYYVFTQTWPINSMKAGADQSKETAADIAAVRKDLGYDHIAIVVGKVTQSGSWQGFEAKMWDLGKEKATMDSPLLKFEPIEWKPPSSKPLAYVGETTEAKVDQIQTWSTFIIPFMPFILSAALGLHLTAECVTSLDMR